MSKSFLVSMSLPRLKLQVRKGSGSFMWIFTVLLHTINPVDETVGVTKIINRSAQNRLKGYQGLNDLKYIFRESL